jgi:hypothetical protein
MEFMSSPSVLELQLYHQTSFLSAIVTPPAALSTALWTRIQVSSTFLAGGALLARWRSRVESPV